LLRKQRKTLRGYFILPHSADYRSYNRMWEKMVKYKLILMHYSFSALCARSFSSLSARYLPERSAITLPLRAHQSSQRRLADFQSLKQKLEKLMISSGTVVSDRKTTPKDSKC